MKILLKNLYSQFFLNLHLRGAVNENIFARLIFTNFLTYIKGSSNFRLTFMGTVIG